MRITGEGAKISRKIHVEVRNPAGEKVCDLYDSGVQFAGQITDITLTRSSNELDTLSFTIPLKIDEPGMGLIENPRWVYIKNEYLIWYTDERGTDVFRIKEPEQASAAAKYSASVECIHRAEALKRRNVAKSLEEQVDDAASHLYRILEGSGWSVGRVSPFYEENLYNKSIVLSNMPVLTPKDMSFGAYAEIEEMAGDSVWDEDVGFANASPRVVSVGKNLCDGMIERGALTSALGLPEYIDTSARYRSINYIDVSAFVGRKLTVSGVNVGGAIWHLYDQSKAQTETVKGLGVSTIPEGTRYIKVEFLRDENGNMDFSGAPSQVQIEVGEQTSYERYKTPYTIDIGPLGKYDTVSGNRIYRQTGYNESTHEVYKLDKVRMERLEIYSVKLYDGGHVYLENTGAGSLSGAKLNYTVEAGQGGTPRLMLRAYAKESGLSCYEAVNKLKELFGGVVLYHGENRTVDLVTQAGVNREVVFYPGKNLNSMKLKRESTEIITRLYVTDQESESGYIGIEDVNPLKSNFLLDFRYFESVGAITPVHRDAIESYEKTVASIGTRQKPVLDEIYAQESAINRVVGQTPMGMADVVTIDGTTVGVGEIVGWLDGESPEAGNTVYLRERNGEWKAYEAASFNAPKRKITLTASPAGASAAWWFKQPPAGSIGARMVVVQTKNEARAALEKQLGLTTDADLIKALRQQIDEATAELLILSQGNESTEGLNAMLAELTSRIGQCTEAQNQIEALRSERDEADSAFEAVMGEMLLDGIFPNGSYASGQELALYTDAKKYLEEHASPMVEYTVDTRDLSSIDGYEIERVGFGDGVFITEPRLGIDRMPATVIKYTDKPLSGNLMSFDVGNFGEKVENMVEDMLSSADTIKKKGHIYDRADAIEPGGIISADVIKDSINRPGVVDNIDLSQNGTITGNPGVQQYITGQITQVTGPIQETVAINREDIHLVGQKVTEVEFKVTDDAIISTVTESNKYQADISGITGLAQDALAKADLNADGLIEVGERLNEAEQKITAEAIVNTVTQSETYTGTIEKLSGDIEILTERVQSAEQRIEPDQIVATVTGSETYQYDMDRLQASVDGIQIGGTNLLLGTLTQDEAAGNYRESVEETGMKLYGCPIFEAVAAGGNIGFSFRAQVIERGLAAAGEELTYSLYLKTDDTAAHDIKITGTKASGGQWFDKSVGSLTAQGNWQRLSSTFIVTEAMLEGDDYLDDLYVSSGSGVTEGKHLYYTCPKLEKGNKATDWTPAPEDVSAYTDAEVDGLGDQLADANDDLNSRMDEIHDALGQLNEAGVETDAVMIEMQKTMETLQQQTNEGFSWTAKVETVINMVDEQGEKLNEIVDNVERYMTFTADDGLIIGKTGANSHVSIDEDSLDIQVNGSVAATFASGGLRTPSMTIGNMRIYGREDGVVVFDRI